jgi:hypothetical protein
VQTGLYQVRGRTCNGVAVGTLLLTTVAFMASRASVPGTGRAAGPEQGWAATLIRFVCTKCSETGQLCSRGLFISQAAVRSNIGPLKPCSAAKLGIREIQVDILTIYVMAGAGGKSGPTLDVQHQPEGTMSCTLSR